MKRRADGRYCIRVRVNGKLHYFYGATRAEVEQKAAAFRVSVGRGVNVNDAQNFSFWAEQWLIMKRSQVSEKFFAQYRNTTERLCARFGGCTLNDIKPVFLQNYIAELAKVNPTTGNPASKRMLELVKQTVSQIYDYAILNRATEFNPAQGIVIPKNAPTNPRRALTPEEIEWIEQLPEIRLKPAVMIMLYAGLRRGEVIPLLWTDINLEEKYIDVNKAVEFPDDMHPRIKSTKTRSGTRRVYFGGHLKQYLEALPRDGELVCPASNGEMMTLSSFRKGWRSVMDELDLISQRNEMTLNGQMIERKSKYDPRFHERAIDNITPHLLRHTFATMMYDAGVDVLTAKTQMGHSSIQTTLQIYTHLSEAHQREEALKLP